MRNVLKSDDEFSTTIADTLSNSTKRRLRQVADDGQTVVDKSVEVARNLQHSSVVKYARNNPIQTAGLIVLGGIVIYSLYRRRNK